MKASRLLLGAAALVVAGCQPGGSGAVAAQPSAPPVASPIAFDSARAFKDLEKQVAFGFRVPGTSGHARCRDWLFQEMGRITDGKAQRQDFAVTVRGQRVPMTNLLARINPSAKKQVLLCAHWDTRPSADQEIDPARKRQPIPGANDGASGVAVLLELARQFAAKPPAVGVQIVLFDGEDYGPGIEAMFLGARHYAKNPALPKPDYAILIDMIGDRDLGIYRETNSDNMAKEINDKVFEAARALGVTAFINEPRHEIMDDHLSLQAIGWRAIDLIDFDYAPWHTLDDTPDKCSPASLKAVGDVLAKVIYDEK